MRILLSTLFLLASTSAWAQVVKEVVAAPSGRDGVTLYPAPGQNASSCTGTNCKKIAANEKLKVLATVYRQVNGREVRYLKVKTASGKEGYVTAAQTDYAVRYQKLLSPSNQTRPAQAPAKAPSTQTKPAQAPAAKTKPAQAPAAKTKPAQTPTAQTKPAKPPTVVSPLTPAPSTQVRPKKKKVKTPLPPRTPRIPIPPVERPPVDGIGVNNTESGSPCPGGCPTINDEKLGFISDLLHTIKGRPITKDHPLTHMKKNYSTRCYNFISPDGVVGPWGEIMLKAMDEVDIAYKAGNKGKKTEGNSCFFDDIDVKSICPGFKEFGKKKKKQYWLYAFASIAHTESTSCTPSEQVPGVNGLADGLFQLEFERKYRIGAGRDNKMCKTQEEVNTQDITFQMQCAASIVRDIHCKKDRPLVHMKGYWQELLEVSRKISQNISKFPGCQKNAK